MDVRIRRRGLSLDPEQLKPPAPTHSGAGGSFLVASDEPASVPVSSVALARLLARSKPPHRVCHLSSPADTRAHFLGGEGVSKTPPVSFLSQKQTACRISLDLYGQSSTEERAIGPYTTRRARSKNLIGEWS